MKLTYRQEGTAEPRVWADLLMGRFRSKEVEAVEARTGMNWGTDFKQALMQGNMLARRALLWVLIKRDHPKTRFDDLDPFDDEVKVELSSAEWQEYYDEIETAALQPGKTEEHRDAVLAMVAKEIADARASEGEPDPVKVAEEGKEPAAADPSGS